ncbi:MAG: sigma-54 dependent transcriptional regulator [Terracidiphilus sp.]
MQACSVPVLPIAPRVRPRTALVASIDSSFRQRISEILSGLRWQVREAASGAEAWTKSQQTIPEALIVDGWFPDLDIVEFLKDFRTYFPEVDLVTAHATASHQGPRSPHHQELLYALRRYQDTDGAASNTAPIQSQETRRAAGLPNGKPALPTIVHLVPSSGKTGKRNIPSTFAAAESHAAPGPEQGRVSGETVLPAVERLPELVGNAPSMLEVSRRIRLVAPRSTPVLIEGPTGSGKEIVAEGLHRLSMRSRKPFVAINCAAIPEALLEAELFGHTRGAFTGAVQGRVGRIESADGGTLFLDEIGEMPLALQSKLLRFVESGELQRVGDNETVKVDVRIVAATHRPLAQDAQTGAFRADLYYRLAVFLIRTPSLAEHAEDLRLLVDHFLKKMGRVTPLKQIDDGALAKLAAHPWPGNVRELEHVLERAEILAGDAPLLTSREIDFGLTVN